LLFSSRTRARYNIFFLFGLPQESTNSQKSERPKHRSKTFKINLKILTGGINPPTNSALALFAFGDRALS